MGGKRQGERPDLVPHGFDCAHLHVTVRLCIEIAALHGYLGNQEVLNSVCEVER